MCASQLPASKAEYVYKRNVLFVRYPAYSGLSKKDAVVRGNSYYIGLFQSCVQPYWSNSFLGVSPAPSPKRMG